ncbi:hypothetical protein Sta7437_3002 [Stanieria cyanosphaera PCC 7437]|uniref:Uncharacterized protein n=1 Tax=Stanieria cyanosphaera (strain ATCC 29371 / PCC 7437) TaxID=111780 RepID=K9XWR1_STAC7|nr:hypothetical protein [Stanieria cyanosphaera]AFZ36521.1 hypothetical protein Sta7437_3002 [Stanieria cyanosphaera PCC 7437]
MNKILLLITASVSLLLTSHSNRLLAHEQENQNYAQEQMHHEMVNIPDNQPIPGVDLIVHEDAKQGWNLEIKTTNFQFAPQKINQEGTLDEGHAHLYVNGEKITRIYDNWYYLSELKPGMNEIKIQLNTNKHEILMHNKQPIEDVETIEVK